MQPEQKIYKVVVLLKPSFQSNSLKEAILHLYDRIKAEAENNSLTLMTIDSCWIEECNHYLFDFFQARDHAYDQGWIS